MGLSVHGLSAVEFRREAYATLIAYGPSGGVPAPSASGENPHPKKALTGAIAATLYRFAPEAAETFT
jgi:hypothetical protein